MLHGPAAKAAGGRRDANGRSAREAANAARGVGNRRNRWELAPLARREQVGHGRRPGNAAERPALRPEPVAGGPAAPRPPSPATALPARRGPAHE